MNSIDTGDTAWLLVATALVLLMTPGLALFYGGMVRSKGVLNMIMMSFVAIALVTIVWLLIGYTLVFGEDVGGGLIGGLEHLGMAGIGPDTVHGTIPELLFATFQLTFAILTAALISGAIADRTKFSAWMLFVPIWTVLVYVPIAHWVWNPDGWIAKLGALDYAGGLVVEIASGASGLALVLVLGQRIGFRTEPMRPHNLPFVLLGVGLLWFGWFGFNAGSALSANGTAAAVFVNTLVAGCTGMLGWVVVEQRRDGHPTTFGAASGVVAGLVAITPSCGWVTILGAAVIGLLAGVGCSFAVGWKFRFGYDDSLDVVGVHLVGGIVGTLGIGLLASRVMTDGPEGLLYGGGFALLGKQALAVAVVGGFAFGVTYTIGTRIDRFFGFRVTAEQETTGIDLALHAESAYEHAVLAHGGPGPLGGAGLFGHQPGGFPPRREESERAPHPDGDNDGAPAT